jgi:hypothetical protein
MVRGRKLQLALQGSSRVAFQVPTASGSLGSKLVEEQMISFSGVVNNKDLEANHLLLSPGL